jgi:SAM-dependent methyltransferase
LTTERSQSAGNLPCAVSPGALTPHHAGLLGLREGGRVIDVGCGLGDYARSLIPIVGRRGQVVGLDASTARLKRASARAAPGEPAVQFVAGDAHNLPFDTGTFDAALTRRTLQHDAEPGRVIGELVRVTRPGGVVLASEPDWGTLVLTGHPRPLVRRMLMSAQDLVRNAWIGRELPALFIDADLAEVHVVAEPVVVRDFDAIRALIDFPALLAEIDDEAAAGQLLDRCEADSSAGRALVAITIFNVCGHVA